MVTSVNSVLRVTHSVTHVGSIASHDAKNRKEGNEYHFKNYKMYGVQSNCMLTEE